MGKLADMSYFAAVDTACENNCSFDGAATLAVFIGREAMVRGPSGDMTIPLVALSSLQ